MLAELMMVLSPFTGDSLPPPPFPPPEKEMMFYSPRREMPIAPGCRELPDYQTRKACTDSTLITFVKDNFYWPNPEWCGEGTAVVQFTIDETGRLSAERIVRSLGDPADRVCRTILERMERDLQGWAPGTIADKPINILYSMPIRFRLQ